MIVRSRGHVLHRTGRMALWACLLHLAAIGVALGASPRSGPGLPGSWWRLVSPPALLLVTGVAAGMGLTGLFFVLRGTARRVAAGSGAGVTAPAEAGGPEGEAAWKALAGSTRGPAVALAVSGGIWTAGHGWVGPMGLAVGAPVAAALTWWALDRWTRGHPPPSGRLVSRLRGASIAVLLAGLALTLCSGSLIVGASLPVLLTQHLPGAPPPAVAAWPSGTLYTVPLEGPSPDQAGEAIHALLHAGSPNGPVPLERTPARTYRPWWPLDAPPALPVPPHLWGRELLPAAADGLLSDADLRWLAELANHPAHAEFDIIGRAASADVVGTRLLPIGQEPISVFEIPVPRYVEMWNGVRSRIAAGVQAHLEGDDEEAERRFMSAANLGRLLYEHGPLPLDALLGRRMADEAAQALHALQAVRNGRREHSVAVQPAREGAFERAPDPRPWHRWDWLLRHAAAAESPHAPKGLRMEGLVNMSTFISCSSPATVLFGPSRGQDSWREGIARQVADGGGERALARLLAQGHIGTRAGVDGWGWLPRTLAMVLGDRPAVTHCAPLAAALTGHG